MLRRTLAKFKPGVPRRIHLLLAASLWSLIGSMLMLRGGIWLAALDKTWIIVPALLAGAMKSWFLLDRTARKGVYRILEMADGTCLGAVYSLQTWLLVVVMMAGGAALRHSSLPREFLGGLYVAIGWALFFSSRHAWLAWRQLTDLRKNP